MEGWHTNAAERWKEWRMEWQRAGNLVNIHRRVLRERLIWKLGWYCYCYSFDLVCGISNEVDTGQSQRQLSFYNMPGVTTAWCRCMWFTHGIICYQPDSDIPCLYIPISQTLIYIYWYRSYTLESRVTQRSDNGTEHGKERELERRTWDLGLERNMELE